MSWLRDNLMPLSLVVAILGVLVTVSGWAMSAGRVSVLMEEAVVKEAATAAALEGESAAHVREIEALRGEVEARLELATSFEEAAREEAEATLQNADARAKLIVQEAEGEAAFRRLTDYLSGRDDLLGVRLAEEMDAEFRVQGMDTDAALAVAASSLLVVQDRLGFTELLVIEQDSTRTMTLAAHANTLALHAITIISFQDELATKDQIIREQRPPGFFRNLFQNFELAAVAVAIGATVTYVVTR